ncbi:MAG TPA: PKD domain-containing protein [Lacibacter sp.]|nr:PKD domain-containing protein [Lacibacter sp.]HMO90146.1 PKD domain-containing protein [Lacibacter sp.]HMP86684.1 PKD domain-containing protein [Lacibacter sp.]
MVPIPVPAILYLFPLHVNLPRLHIILFLLLTGCWLQSAGQNRSNRGREFWLGYGHNVLFTQGNPPNSQNLVLYLSTEQPATVTVSVNGTGWSRTVSIPANSVDAGIVVPKSGADDARLLGEGLSGRGIHIRSDVPIVAYAHQYGDVSSAATMLMPVETYGYSYYSLNYTQVSNYPDSYSWFFAVASEDNTRLEITPADSTQGGWLPGQTYTVLLNRGQIWNVFGKRSGTYTGKDLSGSKIVSVTGPDGNCHPVAVFSGSSRNVLCDGNGGDILQQQIFPANTWGTRYLTHPSKVEAGQGVTTPFLNIYRIAVRNPGTVVKRNGAVLTGLINNFYYEFTSLTGDYIEADQPVLVAQYPGSANGCAGTASPVMGDPEMLYLSPMEQGVKKAVFYHTRNQAIDINYVNVIVPKTGLSSLRIDGTAPLAIETADHPALSSYAVVQKRLTGPAAQHTITCDSSFIAHINGSGFFESYAYNVGAFVNNLNAYSYIENTLSSTGGADSFTCPGAPFRLYARLAYRVTRLVWGAGQVSGISPGRDTVQLNPVPEDSLLLNGRRYYTYRYPGELRAQQAGTFEIPVTCSAPDIDACNQTETVFLPVVVREGPVAGFTTSGNTCAGDTLFFTGLVNAAGFTINRYRWTFPGNSFADVKDTSRVFPASGSYDVFFRITSTNGCFSELGKTLTIAPLPVAAFTGPAEGCSGAALTFTDASTAGTGSIAGWNWGDGSSTTSTTGSAVSHSYAVGTYTVGLQVVSAAGCRSQTAVQNVVVHPNPVAAFTAASAACAGDTLRITDASQAATAPLERWNWNLGDGNTVAAGNGNPVQHRYTNAGTYTIRLQVEDSRGCSSPLAGNNLTVHPLPDLQAGADKSIFAGSSVVLDAAVSNPNDHTFAWTPATGLSDAAVLNPVARPAATTRYTLSATHRSRGCRSTDEVLVTVLAGLFIPNAFTPNGDGLNDAWRIPGLDLYPAAEVIIFNRWGQELLRRRNYNQRPWDGTYGNQPVPAGTYPYRILLNNDAGESRSGMVTVVR